MGFYEHFVEEQYASPCLAEMQALAAPEPEGWTVLAAYAGRLRRELTALFPERPLSLPLRGLLAHCLYWFNAFGKGYLYELTVFSDLRAAGIQFEAHDLSHPEGRRNPYDLTISQRRGDLKSSIYFLHVARSYPLRQAFYITRLWNTEQRTWHNAVLLRPSVWKEVNGETQLATLEQAVFLFPSAAAVNVGGETWVVADYEWCKARVKEKQSPKEQTHEQSVDGTE